MTGMTPEWEFQELFLPQALRGFSLMLCFVPATTLAFGTLAMEHLQNASGLYNLMRNLGGTIGLAALDTMLNERLALHWRRLADSINAADPMVQERLETWAETFGDMIAGDPAAAALNVFAGLVQRQAIVMSFNDCFMVVTGLFLVILLLIPLIRRPSWVTGSSIHKLG
jgi:DHA2 family multidrug resistance protein